MVNQGGVEMRIAIIEDDEITRLELSKLLNTQGYETVLLTDFGNLTDELKQYSIELVLLDINLPYENGYEVCRKIKQVMPVPIIFVSNSIIIADSFIRPKRNSFCLAVTEAAGIAIRFLHTT